MRGIFDELVADAQKDLFTTFDDFLPEFRAQASESYAMHELASVERVPYEPKEELRPSFPLPAQPLARLSS